jgi:hypothetical protein
VDKTEPLQQNNRGNHLVGGMMLRASSASQLKPGLIEHMNNIPTIQGDNPMETVVESILQMFIMTLGGFYDIWEEIQETEYIIIGQYWDSLGLTLAPGQILWFLFIALLVILLLNLLIAMMGWTGPFLCSLLT